MIVGNNSTISDIEPWYIPVDIMRVICAIITIIIALISSGLIDFNKTCKTVPIMLVAKPCLCILVWAYTCLGVALFTLENDMKRIKYQDSLCIFRGYLWGSIGVIHNLSYNLQVIYRYITVIYPSRLFWQSYQFQICLIILIWIFGFTSCIPFLFTNDIIYNAENQICLVPLRPSFILMSGIIVGHIIPVMVLNIIYLKLVRYVRQMNKRVTPADVLARAKRDLYSNT